MESVTKLDVHHEYGNLLIKSCDDGFFWCIESCSGNNWTRISKVLYMALLKFAPKR